jgi:hypothetical protein
MTVFGCFTLFAYGCVFPYTVLMFLLRYLLILNMNIIMLFFIINFKMQAVYRTCFTVVIGIVSYFRLCALVVDQ